jgi:Spy/CpxP family protein refolding chaperone
MRVLFLSIALVSLFAVLAPSSLRAQGPGRNRLSPDERAAELKTLLKLSDEQATKVKSIYEQQDKEMRKLFESAAGDRAAMREAMQKSAKETDEKILALLNEEQQSKYKQLVEERRSRFEQRRLRRE